MNITELKSFIAKANTKSFKIGKHTFYVSTADKIEQLVDVIAVSNNKEQQSQRELTHMGINLTLNTVTNWDGFTVRDFVNDSNLTDEQLNEVVEFDKELLVTYINLQDDAFLVEFFNKVTQIKNSVNDKRENTKKK